MRFPYNPTKIFLRKELFEKFNSDDLLEIKLKVACRHRFRSAIKATELETFNPDDLLEIRLKVVIIVSEML